MNACVVQQVQWAPVPFEVFDANMYVGQRVQLGYNPHGGTPARVEYAPLENMFPHLDSSLLPLGFALLETAQILLGYAPLEVGREGEFSVTAS